MSLSGFFSVPSPQRLKGISMLNVEKGVSYNASGYKDSRGPQQFINTKKPRSSLFAPPILFSEAFNSTRNFICQKVLQ